MSICKLFVVCRFFEMIPREVVEMQENKWLSMKEVCEYLRISRDTVMNWIKKEGMPAHQKGRLWRFDINEVDEWMKNNETEKVSEADNCLEE